MTLEIGRFCATSGEACTANMGPVAALFTLHHLRAIVGSGSTDAVHSFAFS